MGSNDKSSLATSRAKSIAPRREPALRATHAEGLPVRLSSRLSALIDNIGPAPVPSRHDSIDRGCTAVAGWARAGGRDKVEA